MKSKIINVLMFAAGAAIGSAVTWKVVKTQYERIIQEEIDSIKEAFAEYPSNTQDQTGEENDDEEGPARQINWKDLEDLDEDEDDAKYDPDNEDLKEYDQIVKNYNNRKGGAESMAENTAKEPYVIDPLSFGTIDGYHQIELTYYADDTLEDNEGNIITDADELIGPKALTTFGEYEDDAVHVRNERLRTDFEILRDYRTYEEARHIGPDQVDDE